LREVFAEAPASSANLGPGFDVFALAFREPKDTIHLSAEKSDRLTISIVQGRGIRIPLNVEENAAGAVAEAIAKDFGVKAEVKLRIWKGVPIGIGMGSSAASSAAGAVAMNEIFDLDMPKEELIYYAGEGERTASGTAHYDNVSASIMGGFVIVKGGDRPRVISFRAPKDLALCIATPVVKLPTRKTEYARSILPKTTSLKSMVQNVASASTIVSGFALKDIGLIGDGMNDRIVEKARKRLIPAYDMVKSEAIRAGASGVCISGAGPSILAVVDSRKMKVSNVLDAMIASFRRAGVRANGFVTRVGDGAKIVENE